MSAAIGVSGRGRVMRSAHQRTASVMMSHAMIRVPLRGSSDMGVQRMCVRQRIHAELCNQQHGQKKSRNDRPLHDRQATSPWACSTMALWFLLKILRDPLHIAAHNAVKQKDEWIVGRIRFIEYWSTVFAIAAKSLNSGSS